MCSNRIWPVSYATLTENYFKFLNFIIIIIIIIIINIIIIIIFIIIIIIITSETGKNNI